MECKKTKCKLWLEQSAINLNKFKINLQKRLKKLEKEKPSDEKVKIFKEMIADLDNPKEQLKGRKLEMDICSKHYCNPGCKNTIFEDGPVSQLPKSIKKKYKLASTRKLWLQMRKELFGKDNTVLKDSFYIKLPSKTVKQLKKEGAVSGCVQK
jgi:hypothetical protein